MKQLFPKYNFCGLPEEYSKKENSRFLILPIPYEATTTYGHGTALGPKAIIDASINMETYDEELQQETCKLGIHTLPFLEPISVGPEYMLDELAGYVYKEIMEDKMLISLGGEHSISPGIVKAFKKKYPDLSVLHLDAHADLRDSYQGTPYSHACASRRILEYSPVISCGIRSLSSKEAEFIKETGQTPVSPAPKPAVAGGGTNGVKIFWYREALDKTDEIISLLSNEIYITLDVDVLDPSIMPSTGTPEPDGWTWRELYNFLKEIIMHPVRNKVSNRVHKNIVGLDIVELAPMPGNPAPDFTIAKLIYRIMGYIALSKKWLILQNKELKLSV